MGKFISSRQHEHQCHGKLWTAWPAEDLLRSNSGYVISVYDFVIGNKGRTGMISDRDSDVTDRLICARLIFSSLQLGLRSIIEETMLIILVWLT
jgi:hypothetical protein